MPFPFQAAFSSSARPHANSFTVPDKHISSLLNTFSKAIPLKRQLRPVLSSSKTRSMPPKSTSLGFQGVDAAIQIEKKKADGVAARPGWDTLTATDAGRGAAMAITKFLVREASKAPPPRFVNSFFRYSHLNRSSNSLTNYPCQRPDYRVAARVPQNPSKSSS